MNCPKCGTEIKPISYRFTKSLTKSGNSLVITITDEVKQTLNLKHGDLLEIQITKQ